MKFKRANVYEAWKSSTSIIFPQKLQLHPIIGEPDNQHHLRERQHKITFKQIDLPQLRSQSHCARCENIDEEIEEKYSNAKCAALERLWREDVKLEEKSFA